MKNAMLIRIEVEGSVLEAFANQRSAEFIYSLLRGDSRAAGYKVQLWDGRQLVKEAELKMEE